MKDFQLRNDTKLLFRNDPAKDLQEFTAGKKALFVYGSGSVKRKKESVWVEKTSAPVDADLSVQRFGIWAWGCFRGF